MPEVSRDACRLRYEVTGRRGAPALLLLNALGTTRMLWLRQLEGLAAVFEIVTFDMRGHGASDVTEGPYTLQQLGLDAIAVLDAARIERATICGVSLGGLVAMWLALSMPARVERVVLANTAARIGTTRLWNDRIAQVNATGLEAVADAAVGRWFTADFRQRAPDLVEQFRLAAANTSATGYAAACAVVRDSDLRTAVSHIHRPALVIAGTADPVTTLDDGLELCERLPGARLTALDAAHLSNVEQPVAFNAALTAFVEG